MQTQSLNSWKEFQCMLDETEELQSTIPEDMSYRNLFRGQANAEWSLETTLGRLEKRESQEWTFHDYIMEVVKLADTIDTLTGSHWNLNLSDIKGRNTYAELVSTEKHRKALFGYIMYLRHCGFPSPLLDWTESPYIAAFFAFCDMPENAEKVAIYSYQHIQKVIKKVPGIGVGTKYIDESKPIISIIDYAFKTHERHYLQQTQYTLCFKKDGDTEKFGEYDEAVAAEPVDFNQRTDQQAILKYEFPLTERKKFLRRLDKMNISYASLFQDEDYLLKTLALRKLELSRA